jgi:hypothetical protein
MPEVHAASHGIAASIFNPDMHASKNRNFGNRAAMPSFGYRDDDNQVAAVITCIRDSRRNMASAVDADTARAFRAGVAGPVQRSASE